MQKNCQLCLIGIGREAFFILNRIDYVYNHVTEIVFTAIGLEGVQLN